MTARFAKEKLPHGYRLAARIDLIKNRRQLLLVNGLAIVLMLLTIAAGIFLQPQGADNALRMTDDPWGFALTALGMLIYIVGRSFFSRARSRTPAAWPDCSKRPSSQKISLSSNEPRISAMAFLNISCFEKVSGSPAKAIFLSRTER